MPLDGPEMAASGLGRPIGLWVMADGTAAVSVGLSGAYAHVCLGGSPADVQEASDLLRSMGYKPIGRGFADKDATDEWVVTLPYG